MNTEQTRLLSITIVLLILLAFILGNGDLDTFKILFPVLTTNYREVLGIILMLLSLIVYFSFNNKILEGLCSVHKTPNDKDTWCQGLEQGSCRASGCCVSLDGKTCVGGGQNGPTYLTRGSNKVDYEYYIHKGECKGKCPQ